MADIRHISRSPREGSLAICDVPLCVDLDGTLVKTDTLLEAAVAMFRSKPLSFLNALPLLLRGLPAFKCRVQSPGCMRPESLPFNKAVVDLIGEVRSQGRTTVLVTASSQALANEIAVVLGCFDEVYGSNENTNLKGRRKAELLVKKFGYRGYDYVGDSATDIPVWACAREALTTGYSLPVLKNLSVIGFGRTRQSQTSWKVLPRTARVHQWLKNLLVAVPLLASHRITDVGLIARCAIAIWSLSCLASASYILNDLFDVQADRLHASKCSRPIASGEVPMRRAILLGLTLAVSGSLSAMFLPRGAIALIALYVVLTLSYTLYLKRKLLIDGLMLAGLYTLRVLLGGATTGIAISFWLLAFSLFVFVSLALVKRVTELKADESRVMHFARGYEQSDHHALVSIGSSSGVVATLVLALYVNSPEVRRLYVRPDFLWLLCPLVLYWFSRVWIMVERDLMHDDPLVFVFRDRVSRIVSLLGAVTVAAATFGAKLPMGWLIR